MARALRKVVTVKAGGVIEIRVSELAPGTITEVIVLIEEENNPGETYRSQDLATLFKETQALPQARAISEDEIAAEVAAYRTSCAGG